MPTYSPPNDTVLYTVEQRVAHIVLHRPDRYNSYNHDLTIALLETLDATRVDDQVRAIIISGSGPGYSAGADLKGTPPNPTQVAEYMPMYYGAIVKKIMNTPKPIISAIHGTAAGVALGMVLASDLRIMSNTAFLLAPFINIGLGADGGVSWLLTRAVGYSRAYDILTSGEKISAEKCLSMGLCNRISTNDTLIEDATTWARQLASKAPIAIGIIKQNLQHGLYAGIHENIIYESENQKTAIKSEDFGEGVMAFSQKREPKWKGK